MRIKTFVVMAAMLLITACSKEEGDIQTKDVSFVFPVKCEEFHVSDSYAGEVVNSLHLSDVDTAVVKFHINSQRLRSFRLHPEYVRVFCSDNFCRG